MCPLTLTGGPPLEWDDPELVMATELAGRGDWPCCSGGRADWRSARSSSGGLIIAGVRGSYRGG